MDLVILFNFLCLIFESLLIRGDGTYGVIAPQRSTSPSQMNARNYDLTLPDQSLLLTKETAPERLPQWSLAMTKILLLPHYRCTLIPY